MAIDTFYNWPTYYEVVPAHFFSNVLPKPDSTESPEERRRDSMRVAGYDNELEAVKRSQREELPARQRDFAISSLLRLIGLPFIVLLAVRVGLWVKRGFDGRTLG